MRFAQILFLLLFTTCNLFAQTPYQKDFLEFWTDIKNNFAYFDKQQTDWQKVKTIYEPKFGKINNIDEFVHLFEEVINELHNGHITLNTNLPSSNRIIPTGSDMWVEMINNEFVIKDIRKGFKAELCGLSVGMKVVKFNDKPVIEGVSEFLPKSTSVFSPQMYDYAINMLFAGKHNQPRKITVKINNQEKDFYPDAIPNKTSSNQSELLEVKTLNQNIGYIKINNSLGNYDLIKTFDSAVDSLSQTNALILDLTETPSGGNTTIARAIMGRFIEKEMPYQKHSLPSEEKRYGVKRSWIEYVSPRKNIYKKPLIVMVGHWTGSMGEGLSIGFDGMHRAKIVGTKMAGLLGAISGFSAAETKIGYYIPTEKLFHINGTSREDFLPKYLTKDSNETFNKAVKLAISNRNKSKK